MCELLLFLAGGQDTAIDEDVDEHPVHDLELNVDNVFQADDCDAFDSDVDEVPTAQAMFMANLSSADPVNDEAGPSYDSDILSEYVKDNTVPVVHSNVSSVLNDAYMMIYNDMYEPHTQSVSQTSSNTVVENSLTAKLATYKEQVELELLSHIHTTEAIDPEQIFWSQDLIKIKSEALGEQTTVSRPIKALTVYPSNTPATLVPRVLPTKSQGIQKALTKENKGMKDVFEELENEVAQNVVDRKLDEIEWKYLLIANDNSIAECLTKEVFSVATNSELNVARFIEMHVANTIAETRCLKLEAELSNLRDKNHNNNHDELVNRFSNLEHYKELYDSIKITRAKHIEQAMALTNENVNLKAQILDTVNSVSKEHVKPKVLAPGKYAIDVEPIVPRLRNNKEAHLDYLRHLKESVETIRDIVEEAKVVRPLDSSIVPACRVNRCTDASGSKPRSNTKKNRISPAKGVNKIQVKEQPRTNKSHLRTLNRVDSSSRPKRTVVRIILWYLDSGCSKHMTGDRSRLMIFVKKFIGTVRFGNDHFGAIMGYGDYVIGDSVISRVYYVEGLGHNLFVILIWKLHSESILVMFEKRMTEGVATACYTQNRSLIHTRHNTTPYELVHNKKPDLTFFRVFSALCYPTIDSEDLKKIQPTADIGIFVSYAQSKKCYRIYNKRIRRILETIHIQLDELTEPMAPVHLSTRPAPIFLTPGQIIQALVNSASTPSSTTIYQDSPSPSISPSSLALQSHQGVAAESTFMEDNLVAPVNNNPFINAFALKPSSDASSSEDVSSTESTYVSQTMHHLSK
nr:integrase, catalytic region, zinc finger, CCHC-type, peptidase aspartic, catalytic [Tanacetum cinerariifolium]